MSMRYTVNFIRTGQPRAYADSETVAEIVCEIRPYFHNAEVNDGFIPYTPGEVSARNIAKAHVGWVEDEDREWHDTRLVSVRVEDNVIHVHTRTPYTD